jgi:hypothetical protein
MHHRALFIGVAIAAAWLTITQAVAGVLYAATAHQAGPGEESSGRLYAVNAVNGKWRLVGPIRVEARPALAIDGLAVHPKTGLLYGITSRESAEPSLLTIDPRTAQATVIGSLGVRGTDIHFDEEGTLFIWIAETNRLGIVNLATGRVSSVTATGLKEASSGGLAINSRGVALVASRTSRALIEQFDASTGDAMGALALSDASLVHALDALAFSENGRLVAVNEPVPGRPGRELVSIDTETGGVSRIGPLPDDVDAIAFDERARVGGSKRGLLLIFIAVFIGLHIIGALRWRSVR